jgi:hypothetical protein
MLQFEVGMNALSYGDFDKNNEEKQCASLLLVLYWRFLYIRWGMSALPKMSRRKAAAERTTAKVQLLLEIRRELLAQKEERVKF